MPAPNWNVFAAVTLLVLGILIALARASQGMATEDEDPGDADISRTEIGTAAGIHDPEVADIESEPEAEIAPSDEVASEDSAFSDEAAPQDEFSAGFLLLNVALTQGLFGAILVISALLTQIPFSALGVESVTLLQLGGGVVLGIALFGANELGQRAADAFEIDYEDGLRELLTPDSLRGWVVLLGVVLPIIAGFEELLFRSALVGALAAGYGISPWLLALLSTVAFAVGHGAQGPGGILVTGTLGGALAVAFVLSGSLLVVVVAHYLVNVLEFVIHARDAA